MFFEILISPQTTMKEHSEMSNQSSKNILDLVSIACDLLVELHQFVFSSSIVLLNKKKRLRAILRVTGKKLAIFQDCEVVYNSDPSKKTTKGNITPRHPQYFHGWQPARLCHRKINFQEQTFQGAYLFFSVPFIENVLAHWCEKNTIDFEDMSKAIINLEKVFHKERLSEHLPIIADVVVHEMRHEAQWRKKIILRNNDFIQKEYPEIFETVTQELNEGLARNHYQDQDVIRCETDACITGLAARWIWQNYSSPAIRLAKAKSLILG